MIYMDQNNLNISVNNENNQQLNNNVPNMGTVSAGPTVNSVPNQVNLEEQAASQPTVTPVQSVNVNGLGTVASFNVPSQPTSVSNTSETVPTPVPQEQVSSQPTLGNFVNNIPVQENNTVPVAQMPLSSETTPENNGISQMVNQPVQPTVVNTGTVSELPPANETPKKGNSIIIKILIFLLLTAIGIALGYFLFLKFGNKDTQDIDDSVIDNNGEAVTFNNNVINNVNVDVTNLRNVLSIIGIASTTQENNNNILNYYVSNENYKENAREIISYYGGSNNLFNVLPTDVCEGAQCSIISKDNAMKILKLYNFDGNITDYFITNENYKIEDNLLKTDYDLESEYLFTFRTDTSIPAFANGDEFNITHNVTSENIEDNNIKIEDIQVLNYYDENGNVSTTNRTVTYNFVQNENNDYSLSSVSISE